RLRRTRLCPSVETQATFPVLPVVRTLPSGRYAKSVKSPGDCPLGDSRSANPSGTRGSSARAAPLPTVVANTVTRLAARAVEATTAAKRENGRFRPEHIPSHSTSEAGTFPPTHRLS